MELIGLNFSTGRKVILHDISVDFPEGSFSLLIGPNGAGKTSLLRCICGLETADSGRIVRRGEEVDPLSDEWKYQIGMVPEGDSTIGELTVREQMGLVCELFSLPKDESRTRVDSLIGLLQMEDFADERAAVLSTGMGKRLALALSLLHAPEIVLFDEPLNSLDVYISERIIGLLAYLKSAGRTVICTGHELRHLLPLADRIVEMEGGRVANVLNAEGGPFSETETWARLETVKGGGEGETFRMPWFEE